MADFISSAETSISPPISAFHTSFLEPLKNKAIDGKFLIRNFLQSFLVFESFTSMITASS